jgi:hypothetical protein
VDQANEGANSVGLAGGEEKRGGPGKAASFSRSGSQLSLLAVLCLLCSLCAVGKPVPQTQPALEKRRADDGEKICVFHSPAILDVVSPFPFCSSPFPVLYDARYSLYDDGA